ncbi:WW domain-containing protein [Chryseobacterium capnotolerans]|uniref:WW domain-containing protein n=1 Tax=Chryseobacterium TaxID=59732 RepID=UPI00083A4247|nr:MULTISPECIES: WW domain-containing protein [Chryseobacterium]UHO40605.1 WW domain-containing protein [Chryseobacterium capnotolerans]
MEIILNTDTVKKLDQDIRNKISTELKTWEKKTDDNGYTLYYHTTKSGQWEDDLFVKPFLNIEKKQIKFCITKSDGEIIDFEPSFGYLLGRFTEVLMVNFSDQFNSLEFK